MVKIWTYNFSTRIDGGGKLVKKANDYFEALEVQGLAVVFSIPASVATSFDRNRIKSV
jgi:hypothetical protein